MKHKIFQWSIIGAGPAGIAAVGKLLDSGIEPTSILWIDPHFKVGDLGSFWKNVSSNTSARLFINFLQSAHSFGYEQAPIDFPLNHHPRDETCTLSDVVEPLQWISDHLGKKVTVANAMIHSLALSKRIWNLHSDTNTYFAQNVILATGAVPKTLLYPGIETVPFNVAIDKNQLSQHVDPHKTYAVFGSSHSAIIIINYLVNLRVNCIINFYRSPCRYAINMGDWVLFDNSGLKGQTAEWAREHIDGTLPANLLRYISSEANIARFLPECDKAIYAIGFTNRSSIAIENYSSKQYNPHVGIIGPGLFGLGIAYPEIKPDQFGHVEYQVGLWKFMIYLNKVLPIWFKYRT